MWIKWIVWLSGLLAIAMIALWAAKKKKKTTKAKWFIGALGIILLLWSAIEKIMEPPSSQKSANIVINSKNATNLIICTPEAFEIAVRERVAYVIDSTGWRRDAEEWKNKWMECAKQYEASSTSDFERGITAIFNEQFIQADSLFTEALISNTLNQQQISGAYFYRGAIAGLLNDNYRALSLLDSALLFDHGFAEAWYNKGVCWVNLGADSFALLCFDSTLSYDPRYAPAWHNRGMLLSANYHCDDAIASFDSALCYEPNDVEALRVKGGALMSKGDLPAALECFNSAIDIEGGNSIIWEALGLVRLLLQDYDLAIKNFREGLLWCKECVQLYELQGMALSLQGRHEEALQSLDHAVFLNGRYTSALIHRSVVFTLLGKYEAARMDLESSLAVDPGDKRTRGMYDQLVAYMSNKNPNKPPLITKIDPPPMPEKRCE
jgi:tetratricopeptide (TPR) repeat protein